MKKLILSLLLLHTVAGTLLAQDEKEEEKKGGFKKENLFTGGNVTLSFFNHQTLIGANPIFGYKIADWLDAGLSFNYLYASAKDNLYFGDKVRQTVIGPGVFTRIYPVKFLFFQGQFEQNFIKQKYIYPGGSPTDVSKTDVSSFLVGGGIAQGREKGSTTFYYISILFDVLKNANSPYTTVVIDPNNPSNRRVDITPVIRAGINIGLFQGRYGKYNRYD